MENIKENNVVAFQEYGQKLKSFCEKVIILNVISGMLNFIIKESVLTNIATVAIYYFVYTFAMKLIRGEQSELTPFFTVIKVVLFLGVILNGFALISGVPALISMINVGTFESSVILWLLLSVAITSFVLFLQFTLLQAHLKLERTVK